MKLRVLLFVFFPLFVKEWEKIPLDEEQDIFNSWHFKLGVEFPVFLFSLTALGVNEIHCCVTFLCLFPARAPQTALH